MSQKSACFTIPENCVIIKSRKNMKRFNFLKKHKPDNFQEVIIMNKNIFKTVKLKKGEMNIYDFGRVKLHAYKTNDFIDDEVFVVEKNGKAVIIESPCFFDNNKELSEYLNDLEVEGMLISYHGAGATFLPDIPKYATQNAADFSSNGDGKTLIDNFTATFGEIFDRSIHKITNFIEEGKITIGGADLASMPAKWVREHVGVVLQEPFLFSRTIEENIGITGASAEEIRQAAITACVDEDIRQFAKGYETMVGERGVTLSGGQKQRVAIARTLTGRTPIVVFDDSLSAVDTETDEAIRGNLKKQVSGVTQILVSHRILTLLDCDQVLVLEHGAVRQIGTPAALLQQEGPFREIYQMQMAIGEEEPA